MMSHRSRGKNETRAPFRIPSAFGALVADRYLLVKQ
jgi:hypothetical protein